MVIAISCWHPSPVNGADVEINLALLQEAGRKGGLKGGKKRMQSMSGAGCTDAEGLFVRLPLAILAVALCLAGAADARSKSPVREFRRDNPCPATGKTRGACPGYVIDHIRPLCAGGPDHPSNMQWQTRADSIIKDREERRECRALRTARR